MLHATRFLHLNVSPMLCMELFGYPCYKIPQFGVYFSTARFLHFFFNTLVSIYKSFNSKRVLKKRVIFLSAFEPEFFGNIQHC